MISECGIDRLLRICCENNENQPRKCGWLQVTTCLRWIELVNELIDRGVDLQSINDPIDTTTAQGRLSFNIFACLAEFERDIIRERTQAGLSA